MEKYFGRQIQIIAFCLIVIIIFTVYIFDYFSKPYKIRYINNKQINGVIVRKYIDVKNHNIESIETENQKINLSSCNSELYNYLNLKDKIMKPLNSLDFKIERKGQADTIIKFIDPCIVL